MDDVNVGMNVYGDAGVNAAVDVYMAVYVDVYVYVDVCVCVFMWRWMLM